MSSELREELLDIRGVGEAKADRILDLVDEYGGYGVVCRDALELLEDGHAGHAENHLKNAVNEGE